MEIYSHRHIKNEYVKHLWNKHKSKKLEKYPKNKENNRKIVEINKIEYIKLKSKKTDG